MKRFNRSMLVGVLTTMLTILLLTRGGANAASPTCGAWSVVKSPNVGSRNNVLQGVAAVTATNVWAVGAYQPDLHKLARTLTEHWNGTNWSIVKSPNAAGIINVLVSVADVSANDIWAVGYYETIGAQTLTLVEHWNGTQWSVVKSPNIGSTDILTGVAAISSSDVWAVGHYINNAGVEQTLVEHWNGTTWSVVHSPNVGISTNALSNVAAISSSDVWAVGHYMKSDGAVQTLVEHWNGTTWSVVHSPNLGSGANILDGLAAVSANDIWAVGWYQKLSTKQTLIEHWNGTQWSPMHSPNLGSGANILLSVAAISATDVWAVGAGKGNSATLTEQWNGTKWSIVPSPSPGASGNALQGVTAIANTLWSVGWFSKNGNGSRTLTEFFC